MFVAGNPFGSHSECALSCDIDAKDAAIVIQEIRTDHQHVLDCHYLGLLLLLLTDRRSYGGIVRRWRNVSGAAERRESKRRKPFTLEDAAANIANCRHCWTRGTQPIMSEDAAPRQLERRGNRQKVAKRL